MTIKFKKTLLAVSLLTAANSSLADGFERVASYPTKQNLASNLQQNPNSSEIITANQDETRLIYTDSLNKSLGFFEVSSANSLKPKGILALNGEPTSVVAGKDYAYVALNTSKNYREPSGELLMVDIKSQQIVASCPLNGQPDSIALSKDGNYLAIAIENERDEKFNGGQLPQAPAGALAIAKLDSQKIACNQVNLVPLLGLAEVGTSDPEPEFVDFNQNNEIVMSLQENNHLVIVDAKTAKIVNHFSAGSVKLTQVDSNKDGNISATDSIEMPREPDTVKWLDNDRFVTANEGDYQGGARGFTIFNKKGEVLFESGAEFEHKIIQAGHYPEKRSNKKGNEPEGLAIGKIGDKQYIFVLSERSSIIGVYEDTGAAPKFVQLLPSGIAPESAVFLPKLQTLVSANEKDLRDENGAGSHVMLYQFKPNNSTLNYPQIISNYQDKQPIGWGALSALSADKNNPERLYAVSDSYYSTSPAIFSIDKSQYPAEITQKIVITQAGKPAEKLDLEGIALSDKGGFWLASEGNQNKGIAHAIYHSNAQGEIDQRIDLPKALLDNQTRFGAEGITQVGNTLWIAMQRPWQDDPANTVKLLAYNLDDQSWRAVRYPLEKSATGWTGLSEITAFGDHLYVIERDNQLADNAKIKRLYKIKITDLQPAELNTTLPVVNKVLSYDFLADLKAANGYINDKVEGFAIDKNGKGYAVTDNDGVDDSSGETLFFSVNYQ